MLDLHVEASIYFSNRMINDRSEANRDASQSAVVSLVVLCMSGCESYHFLTLLGDTPDHPEQGNQLSSYEMRSEALSHCSKGSI